MVSIDVTAEDAAYFVELAVARYPSAAELRTFEGAMVMTIVPPKKA